MPSGRAIRLAIAASLLVSSAAGVSADEADAKAKPWAFQPVAKAGPPKVPTDAQIVANPIDAFIAKGLADDGLQPAPPADRRTLIRRVTFDLTGLPPTPEDVSTFIDDNTDDAYNRLVERLLASPDYGERWGRHWLDLVRYAETHGYERDEPKPNAWKYRDWVITAFNEDKPYDRFILEQIAGDELPDANDDTRTATGMYRLGLIDDEPADPVVDRFDQLDDMLKTLGTTFLGLTLHCARCHDHKFDPITQRDYYRMLAFLTPGKPFVRDHDESISLPVGDKSLHERVRDLNAAVDRQIAHLQKRHDGLAKEPATEALRKALDQRIDALRAHRPKGAPSTLGLTDVSATPAPTKMFVRGDAHKPGEEVQPGFISAIDPATPHITAASNGNTTGRRLALARWIARPENPLTARVLVNRLWQHHFGRGIVGTPSDFGAMGEQPSDPRLLDWLANELVASGWRIKHIHRLIVSSETYRRSGAWDEQAAQVDPVNSRVWRHSPRRLEAEAVRDAILSVSGALNRERGGPSVFPPIDKAVLAGQSRPGLGWTVSDERSAARRSIYVYVKRTLPLPELEVLDAADSNDVCPSRVVTTTAPQALTLLNSEFLHKQSATFAARLKKDAGACAEDQIDRAFWLAFQRTPSEGERGNSIEFLKRQRALIARRPTPTSPDDLDRAALESFCLVLLNANEFLTID